MGDPRKAHRHEAAARKRAVKHSSQKFNKHHRGNVSLLHETVAGELVYILEHMGRETATEEEVPGISDGNAVVDVVDISDPAHPVYYEVEDKGRTKRYQAKEAEFVGRLGRDLVLVNLQDLRKAHGSNPGYRHIEKWLRGLIL